MATFYGYNTIGAVKKVTLVDKQLVIRDLLNAFNLKQGSVPGRPDVGCPIWSYVFENATPSIISDMKQIINVTCRQDPRIQLRSVELFQQENGVLFELEVMITTDVQPTQLNVFFDRQAQQANLL